MPCSYRVWLDLAARIRRIRWSPASPNKPVPPNRNVAGSGAADVIVSPVTVSFELVQHQLPLNQRETATVSVARPGVVKAVEKTRSNWGALLPATLPRTRMVLRVPPLTKSAGEYVAPGGGADGLAVPRI